MCRLYVLPVAALLFLFSGFYKGLIVSPLDLTIAAAGLTCAATFPFRSDLLGLLNSRACAFLAALTAYLALRLWPGFPAWGARKLAETVLFGVPAVAAGYVIARHRQRELMALLSWAAIPAAIGVTANAAFGNPYTYHWLGSGGYQLTGIAFALAAIAAAASVRAIAFGFAVLGAAVCGHISGALFAAMVIPAIWIVRPDGWVKQASAALALLALYTALVAPPLVVMRGLWKAGGMLVAMAGAGDDTSAFASASYLQKTGMGRAVLSTLKAMPHDSQRYLVEAKAADRSEIYAAAWHAFTAAPLFGNGYGDVDYAGEKYPHNILLEMLAEGGVIGAGALAATLVFATLAARSPFVLGYYVLMLLTFMVSGYWGERLLLFGIGLVIGDRERVK